MICRSQRGVALVSVLWGVGLIAVLAAAFVHNTRTEARIAFNIAESAKARALAEGGIAIAVARIAAAGANRNFRWNGTADKVSFGGGSISIKIQDEAGKIDLNAASAHLLSWLFRAAGAPQATADSLSDAVLDKRAGNIRNHFVSVDQARDLPGMTDQLFRHVRTGLTVHSRKPGVDTSVAVPLVAQAVALLTPLGNTADRSDTAKDSPNRFSELSTRNAFTIESRGVTSSGATFLHTVIVRNDRGPNVPYQIYAWR